MRQAGGRRAGHGFGAFRLGGGEKASGDLGACGLRLPVAHEAPGVIGFDLAQLILQDLHVIGGAAGRRGRSAPERREDERKTPCREKGRKPPVKPVHRLPALVVPGLKKPGRARCGP